MQVTHRFWTTAAVGLVLAGTAVVFDRPLLLVGAAGVGAWLLTIAFRFVYALRRTDTALTVEQAVTPPRTATDSPVEATLGADLPEPLLLPLTIELRPPVSVRVESGDPTVSLDAGERTGDTSVTVEAPIAGAFEFPRPEVRARDPFALFEETFERGNSPTLTVEPRAPRNVHVGQGGEQVAAAYGEHDAGRLGSGLEPAEIREYIPGDDASRIDWKATARLNHPHVREFEAETDRTTVLAVDHRATMGSGRDGETKLEYAREVALAFLASARDLDDPLGMYAIGDGGVTVRSEPAATPDKYNRVRTALYDLAPTASREGAQEVRVEERSPAAARGIAARFDDDAAFGRTLAPYFATAEPYVDRVATDPLFRVLDTYLGRLGGTVWTVLFTDDEHRNELREAVKVARRGNNQVLVFLTPSALFDRDGLTDLDGAYERYHDFEEFRRQLDRLDRVTAFEVAPGDRLQAVLSAREHRRPARGAD